MSFIPLVAETASAVGSFIGEETGSSLLGAIATSEVGKKTNELIESGSKSFVDSIFGPGTFENLESSISQTYSSGKALAEDIYNVRDQVESGQFGREQLNKLENDKEAFNKTGVVRGISEFSKDLSHLVSTGGYNALDSTNSVIVNNQSIIANVLNTLARVNPFYSYLASKFNDKLSDFVIPTSEDYLKVASVYNGQGLYLQKMKLESFGSGYEFSILDEIGTPVIWKYPEYNNYTVVPPVYGTWTGINSPNNSLCLSGSQGGQEVESFLDKIAFMHDVGYHDLGSFNEFSDYQLISRANYGRQNGLFIFPGELATAQVAISYFSTLGSLMRKMFGTTNDKSSEPMIKEILTETVKLSEVSIEEVKQSVTDTVKSIPTSHGSDIVGNSNFELVSLINNLEISLN